MHKPGRIFVAGHRGLVGAAICRRLADGGDQNLIRRDHDQLDLCDQQAVDRFFEAERPEYVFLAAARVGGILANSSRPAEFIRHNLLIQCNVMDAAWRHGVRKLVFLGSSRIYPKLADQPIREEYLLSGPLEPTNEAYAVAKIAGLKMVDAYRKQYRFCGISLMPTNLYGGQLRCRKFARDPRVDSKISRGGLFVCSGSGSVGQRRATPRVPSRGRSRRRRGFHFEHYDEPEIVNVGTGADVTIACWRSLSPKSQGTVAGFDSTLRCRMARLANYSISRGWPRSVGNRGSRCAPALKRPTVGTPKTRQTSRTTSTRAPS